MSDWISYGKVLLSTPRKNSFYHERSGAFLINLCIFKLCYSSSTLGLQSLPIYSVFILGPAFLLQCFPSLLLLLSLDILTLLRSIFQECFHQIYELPNNKGLQGKFRLRDSVYHIPLLETCDAL